MYSGQTAIDHLVAEITKIDAGTSSHWLKYHSKFRFTGDGFEGLEGFGGSEKPHLGLRLWLNRLLQRKFRQMGAGLPDFMAIDKLANKMTNKQARAYDLDVLRQVLTLAFLKKHIPNVLSAQATACVIGDGFASMTALLLASRAAGRVVLVNLSKTLLVDLWYLKQWMGAEAFESSVTLVTDENELSNVLQKPVPGQTGEVIAIQASNHELLQQCRMDLVLNIASMQEMDPPVTAAYFNDLRVIASKRKFHFYCCNREEKMLPDGTTSRFADYPWSSSDKILVDELCPWHQQYYSLRPPFYRPYAGPHRHRLLTLT